MRGKVYTLADIALTHAKTYKGELGPPAKHDADRSKQTNNGLILEDDDIVFRQSDLDGSDDASSPSDASDNWRDLDDTGIDSSLLEHSGTFRKQHSFNDQGVVRRQFRQHPLTASINRPLRGSKNEADDLFQQQQRLLEGFTARKKRRVQLFSSPKQSFETRQKTNSAPSRFFLTTSCFFISKKLLFLKNFL